MAGDEWPQWAVFPAHAGMSLIDLHTRLIDAGFPRSRGDEPTGFTHERARLRFSPLTRG